MFISLLDFFLRHKARNAMKWTKRTHTKNKSEIANARKWTRKKGKNIIKSINRVSDGQT